MRKLKTHELNRLSTQDFGQLSKFPIVIVLDNLRSMYNIGSIFRTWVFNFLIYSQLIVKKDSKRI